jgi:hypothetical protein
MHIEKKKVSYYEVFCVDFCAKFTEAREGGGGGVENRLSRVHYLQF